MTPICRSFMCFFKSQLITILLHLQRKKFSDSLIDSWNKSRPVITHTPLAASVSHLPIQFNKISTLQVFHLQFPKIKGHKNKLIISHTFIYSSYFYHYPQYFTGAYQSWSPNCPLLPFKSYLQVGVNPQGPGFVYLILWTAKKIFDMVCWKLKHLSVKCCLMFLH